MFKTPVKKSKRKIINRYTVSVFILVVIAAAVVTVLTLKNSPAKATAASKPATTAAAVPSQFSFTGAANWWQGATNKTSMALFPKSGDCFTSVNHKSGTVDINAELAKITGNQASGGAMVALSILSTTIQTTTGAKPYQLHQYHVTNPDVQVMEGMELGYVQLSGSYIEVEGYCNTPDQLPTTLPALQAIRFNPNK